MEDNQHLLLDLRPAVHLLAGEKQTVVVLVYHFWAGGWGGGGYEVASHIRKCNEQAT